MIECMTKEQTVISIKTGSLQLGRWDKFNHYFPAIGLFSISAFFPAFWLYDLLKGFTKPINQAGYHFLIGFASISLALAVVVYIFQKRQLRLTKIGRTKLGEEPRKLVTVVAKKLRWVAIVDRADAYVAVTNPAFWSGSCGERITILYDDDIIWANSICDPQRQSSIVSCGRNKANVRALIKTITNPSKKAFVT